MPKNNHYTLSFQDAKKIVHSYGFKTHPEYSRFMNSSKRPVNLPKAPQYIYKDQWVSWPDFLGVKKGAKTPTKCNASVRGSAKQFLPYAKAKAFVQKIGLKSHKQYRVWSKSVRPKNIPGHPSDFYKDEFEGWAQYLGTKTEPHAQQMPDLFVEVQQQPEQPIEIEEPTNVPEQIEQAPIEKPQSSDLGKFVQAYLLMAEAHSQLLGLFAEMIKTKNQ